MAHHAIPAGFFVLQPSWQEEGRGRFSQFFGGLIPTMIARIELK